jgi:lipopolysaccharide exporter
MEEEASLGARTVRGALWAYGSYGLGRVLVLITTALLARLLTPDEFGLVALAILATSILDRLADFGVSEALIVSPPERAEDQARTAFVFSMGMAILMAGVTAALAPLAAGFFHEDGLNTVMPLLGLTFPLRAIGAVHYALAQKTMDFRSRTAAELADVIVRGGAGIGAALAGAGAYSLVVGYLAGTAAMSLVLWVMVRWRPRRPEGGYDFRALAGFGGTLSALDLIAVVNSNADYFIIGRVLGTEQLGLYTLAFRLPEMLILNVSVVASQVLYPAFATLDRERLNAAFVASIRWMALICLPIAAVLSGLAAPLVGIAFGSQWTASVQPMRVLTLYAATTPIHMSSGTAYKSMRRVGILVWMAIPRGILLIAAMILVVHQGIVAVALCQAIVGLVFTIIGLLPARSMLHTPVRQILAAMVPSLLASGVLFGIGFAAASLIDDDVAAVAAGLGAGLPAWFAVMWLLAREQLHELTWRLPLGRFRRSGAAA